MRTRLRLGLTALAAQALSPLLELVVAGAAWFGGRAPYDLVDNTISDLGAVGCGTVPYPWGPVAVCSPAHGLLNGGFIALGALLAGGAVFARPLLPGRLGAWAIALWVVAGLSSIATGLVPIDVDLDLHALVSVPVFLAQPVAHLLTALAVRRDQPRLAAWGVALALLSIVAGVVYTLTADQPFLGGLWERLTLWPAFVWLGAFGWVGLRHTRIEPAEGSTS